MSEQKKFFIFFRVSASGNSVWAPNVENPVKGDSILQVCRHIAATENMTNLFGGVQLTGVKIIDALGDDDPDIKGPDINEPMTSDNLKRAKQILEKFQETNRFDDLDEEDMSEILEELCDLFDV